MNEIIIHHTLSSESYYYTEKMKSKGLVFVTNNYDNDKNQFCTSLDLIGVEKDNAFVYNLYDSSFKETIEIYMMVKLIVDQYGTDNFYGFVHDVSFGSMNSDVQSSKQSQKEIYKWLFERFNDFLEEIGELQNDKTR